MNRPPEIDDEALLHRLHDSSLQLKSQLQKVVVGQSQAIDLILNGLLSSGHCLLIGVPGLAKTLIVRTFASILNVGFSRIQFTPDLMPSDVTGTDVLVQNQATGDRDFRFLKGPVFSNIVLADEINRAPPKTQSALLEAMQERQVTIGAVQHPLPNPFFVLATQNPIEQEGTYPLPEAQLDRFMFVVQLDYPSESDELEMLLRTTGDSTVSVTSQMSAVDILEYRHLIRRIPISEGLASLALQLVRLTRPNSENPIVLVRECVAWGAGPRAGQFLILAAKTSAALRGSAIVLEDDLLAVVQPVLQHRIKTNYTAQAKGVSESSIIELVMNHVREQLQGKPNRGRIAKLFQS